MVSSSKTFWNTCSMFFKSFIAYYIICFSLKQKIYIPCILSKAKIQTDPAKPKLSQTCWSQLPENTFQHFFSFAYFYGRYIQSIQDPINYSQIAPPLNYNNFSSTSIPYPWTLKANAAFSKSLFVELPFLINPAPFF